MTAKIAYLFPGQGAQSVGMGQDLYTHFPAAREIIDQFSQWVLPDLRQVTFEGPEDTLKRTLYTQPAILSVSLAALTVLQTHVSPRPAFAAGHSLGEYGALVAAGAISVETAAKLVKKRAELMENAPPGAMAAILGLPPTEVEKAVLEVQGRSLGALAVANYNTPEQSVISGTPEAVEAACAYAKETLGASKAIMLPVGGAFHSPLMQPAGEAFEAFVQDFSFSDSQFPVVTNVDAQPTTAAGEFRAKLSRQIYGSVRWVETIEFLKSQGVDTFVEIGPGKVLTGMMKRMAKDARLFNVFDSASLAATVEALSTGALVS